MSDDELTYGKYSEYDNVYDFVEYKLHALVTYAADAGRVDIATAMIDALDAYLMGEVDIIFVDGWPHASRKPEFEERGENKT
tara:strand:+ start:390 stop:635 length:246 start_codon:yes stop_codon:yes gene_type:complete